MKDFLTSFGVYIALLLLPFSALADTFDEGFDAPIFGYVLLTDQTVIEREATGKGPILLRPHKSTAPSYYAMTETRQKPVMVKSLLVDSVWEKPAYRHPNYL